MGTENNVFHMLDSTTIIFLKSSFINYGTLHSSNPILLSITAVTMAEKDTKNRIEQSWWFADLGMHSPVVIAFSYTDLTLPTILRV